MKAAVNYISDFEEKLAELAKAKGCDGIICGHIHQPAIRMIGDIEYLNSGDWVESLSALVEDHEGNWSLLYFSAGRDENEPNGSGGEHSEFSEQAQDEPDEEHESDLLQALLALSSVKP